MQLTGTLTLEQYDHDNFGFLRIEVTKEQIFGTYLSAPYEETKTAIPKTLDSFVINLDTRKVATVTVKFTPLGGRS